MERSNFSIIINTYSYYIKWLLRTIYNFVDPAFCTRWYSKWVYSLIDQRLSATACRQPGYVRQVCATTSYSSIIVSHHELLFELLLIDMYRNCTGTGYEVHACTASSYLRMKILFHKLKSVIRFFMRKTFMVQCHLQNINIKLFPTMVYVTNLWKPKIMAYTKIFSIYYKAL